MNKLRNDRRPGSLEEARTLEAYNERILQTSASAQLRHRAERMLANLQPLITELQRQEADRIGRIEASAPPVQSFEGRVQKWRDEKSNEEFEIEWDGKLGHDGKSLTKGEGLGSSLGSHEQTLHRH